MEKRAMSLDWWKAIVRPCFRRDFRSRAPGPTRGKRPPLALEQLEPRAVPSAAPVVSLTYNNVTITPAVTRAFVTDLYGDVLFRLPDAQGLNSWTNQLNSGALTGGGAFAGVAGSPEFAANVDPLLTLYEAYLNRPADASGLRSWENVLHGGQTMAQVAIGIAQSPEFIHDNGDVLALSDPDFVTFLYQKLFNRTPSPGERDGWVHQLTSGIATRGQLMVTFTTTSEYAAHHPQAAAQNAVNIAYTALWNRSPDADFNTHVAGFTNATALGNQFIVNQHYLGGGAARNYVVGLYEGLLQREPDAAGYRNWRTALLNQAMTDTAVYAGFINSAEFRAANPGSQFVPNVVTDTYQALLGRSPTAAELDAGTAFLNAGNSPSAFAAGFLSSAEFTQNGYAQNIQHTVVVYQENWSFDALLGLFPGVNGIANANPAAEQQLMRDGMTAYIVLPQSADAPANLPSLPFDLNPYTPFTQATQGDPTHLFYQEQAQIHNGLMNQFVAWGFQGSATQGTNLVMSYYNSLNIPGGYGIATQYTIADNLFHSAFGGSWLNAMWLIMAQAPVYNGDTSQIPSGDIAVLDSNGLLKLNSNGTIENSGIYTPDFFPVNDIDPANFPNLPPGDLTLPTLNDSNPSAPNYQLTLGDLLNAHTSNGQGDPISWKWYAEGWDQAITTGGNSGFIPHHQPYAYFSNYQVGSVSQKAHLQDLTNFTADLANGQLPTVAYLKGLESSTTPHDEHPGVGPEQTGQQWAVDQVTAVQQSTAWANSSVLITYDENGGRWDHVQPPAADRWGPGSRIPMMVISPYAKRGFVDHTQYETVSIDKTLEAVYHLPALSTRDANANPMFNSYTFSPTDIIKNN
jgi:phospholipase C